MLRTSAQHLVDDQFGAAVTIDSYHAMIHDGKAFQVSFFEELMPNAGSLDVLIRVGSNPIDMILDPRCQNNLEIIMAEDVEVDGELTGQEVEPISRNRLEINPVTVKFFQGPTLVDEGSRLVHDLLTGGSGPNVIGPGEWILKLNTDYSVRVIHIGPGKVTVSLHIHFYEVHVSAA